MNRLSRNLSIILRAERLIAQRRMAVLRRQTVMMGAAGIVGLLGLIMLDGAAYFALVEHLSRPMSALIVSLVNIVFAAILVSMAHNQNAEQEVASVAEVRDMAVADLEMELQSAAEEAKSIAQNLQSAARDPLGMIAPGLLSALVAALVKALKK